MGKQLVIWDWDGTIVDNFGSARLALQDMADKYQLGKMTEDDLQNVMGAYRGAFWLFHFQDKADEPYRYFIKRFAEYNQKNMPVVYEGVQSALEYLKERNIPQVVLSNMPQAMLDRQAEDANLQKYFVRLVGLGNGERDKKPYPEHIQKAINQIDFDTVIVVGDGESDLMTAENIAAKMIYIHKKNRSDFRYDYLATTHRQILAFLKLLIEGNK